MRVTSVVVDAILKRVKENKDDKSAFLEKNNRLLFAFVQFIMVAGVLRPGAAVAAFLLESFIKALERNDPIEFEKAALSVVRQEL